MRVVLNGYVVWLNFANCATDNQVQPQTGDDAVALQRAVACPFGEYEPIIANLFMAKDLRLQRQQSTLSLQCKCFV